MSTNRSNTESSGSSGSAKTLVSYEEANAGTWRDPEFGPKRFYFKRPKCFEKELIGYVNALPVRTIRPDCLENGEIMRNEVVRGPGGYEELTTVDVFLLANHIQESPRAREVAIMFFRVQEMSPSIRAEFFKYARISDSIAGGWLRIMNKKQDEMISKRSLRSFIEWIIMCAPKRKSDGLFWSVKNTASPNTVQFIDQLINDALMFYHKKIEEFDVRHIRDTITSQRTISGGHRPIITFEYDEAKNCKELAESNPEWRHLKQTSNRDQEPILTSVNVQNDFDGLFGKLIVPGFNVVNIEKLKHEAVCEYLFQDASDERFDKYFGSVPGLSMNLTPDKITQISENKWHIYELATSKSDDTLQMEATLIRKYHKYQDVVYGIMKHYKEELGIKLTIELRIVVVSFNTVVINFSPENTVLDFNIRTCPTVYKIAEEVSKDLMSRLPLRDPINLNDDMYSSKVQMFIRSIEDYSLRSDLEHRMKNNNLYISPDMIQQVPNISMEEIVEQDLKSKDLLKDHFQNLDPKKTYESKNLGRKMIKSTKRVLRVPDFYNSDIFNWTDIYFADDFHEGSKTMHSLLKTLIDPDVIMNDLEANIEIEERDREFLIALMEQNQDETQEDDEMFTYCDYLTNSEPNKMEAGESMNVHKKRGQIFRAKCSLNKDEKQELNLEKHNQDPSGEILDWETNVKDIQDFLKRVDLFDDEPLESSMIFEQFAQELDNAPMMDAEQRDILMSLGSKRIFCYLRFWSLVFQTVSKSLLIFTGKDDLIIKNVEGTNAKVLIKNSSTKGPVWISVVCKNSDTLNAGDVFGKYHLFTNKENGDKFYASNFVSYQFSDLEMFVNAFEILVGLYAVIEEVFDKDREETFMVCFLVFMEAKSKTCADMMNLRYLYMELIKTDEEPYRAPFKILDKFDNNVRSRLHLWLWKRMESLYKLESNVLVDSDNREEVPEDQASEERETSDLYLYKPVNFVTGNQCSSVRECLFLSYLGVLKNKKDVEKFSNSKKMLRKIISQELKLKDMACWYFYLDRSKDFNKKKKTHQFTPSFVKCAAKNIWGKIKENSGCRDQDHFFRSKIIPELMKKTLDDIATFKSSTIRDSAVFDDVRPNFLKESLKGSKGGEKQEKVKDSNGKDVKPKQVRTIARSKLITVITEDIQKEMLTNPHIMMDAPFFTAELDNFIVSLFKKDQWGGLREIYVLDFKSRVLALFVETISRTLASYLDNEILTKGNDKSKESRNHRFKTKTFKKLLTKIAEEETEGKAKFDPKELEVKSYHDAADRTTWCQQFINPIFMMVLSELVPDWTLPMISDILNLHTLKLIQIPEDLCRAFVLNPLIVDTDENIQALKDEYLGRTSSNLVLKPGSTWIRNESNMMQGILHFTSSLLHSSIMYLLEERIKHVHKELNENHAISISYSSRVSSDDASFTVTFMQAKRNRLDTNEIFLDLCGWHLQSLQHFCVQDSIKSTHFITKDVQEFNSEFEVGNSKVFPTVPHLVASLQLPSEVDPYKRILELYNTRTALMEKGISGETLMKVCYLQRRVHYKCLMGASEAYNFLALNLLRRMPIDFLGYFYMDVPYIGPALGESFNRFAYMSTSEACKGSFDRFVMMTGVDNLVENSLEFQFRWKVSSDLRKMNDMIRGMTSEEKKNDMGQYFILGMKREVVNGLVNLKKSIVDFSCKFRGSNTLEESICKIVEKTFDSNLARSLSFVDKISTIRISAFFLSSICIRLKKSFKVNPELKEILDKFSTREHSFLSVLAVLNLINQDLTPIDEDESGERRDWKRYFPLNLDYGKILHMCELRHSSTNFVQRLGKPVMRKLPLKVHKGDLPGLVSNLDVIKSIWYNLDKPNSNKRLILEKWKILKLKLPWLRNSPEETLIDIDCPFDSETAIISFFEKWTILGSRSLSLMGPYVNRIDIESKLQSVIERFYDHSRIYRIDLSQEEHFNSPLECWKALRFFPLAYKRYLLERKKEPELQDFSSLKFLDSDAARFSRFEDITAWPELFVDSESSQYTNEIFHGENDSGLEVYSKTYKDFSQISIACRNRFIQRIKSHRCSVDQIEKFVFSCVSRFKLDFPMLSRTEKHKSYVIHPLLKLSSRVVLSEVKAVEVEFWEDQITKDALYTNHLSAHMENSWLVITLEKRLSITDRAEKQAKKISDQPNTMIFEDQALKLNLKISPEPNIRAESTLTNDPGSFILSQRKFEDLFWACLNMSSMKEKGMSRKGRSFVASIFSESPDSDITKEICNVLLKDLNSYLKSIYDVGQVKRAELTADIQVEGELGLERANFNFGNKEIQDALKNVLALKLNDDDLDGFEERENQITLSSIIQGLKEISLDNKSSNVREWTRCSNVWRGCKILCFNLPESKSGLTNLIFSLSKEKCPDSEVPTLLKRLNDWTKSLRRSIEEKYDSEKKEVAALDNFEDEDDDDKESFH